MEVKFPNSNPQEIKLELRWEPLKFALLENPDKDKILLLFKHRCKHITEILEWQNSNPNDKFLGAGFVSKLDIGNNNRWDSDSSRELFGRDKPDNDADELLNEIRSYVMEMANE